MARPSPTAEEPSQRLPYPKAMIVQSFNTQASGPQGFDIFMAAGGYGAYNACYNDPAFENPTKFVGPVYEEFEANKLVQERGWNFRLDGDHWRRVVPSPKPQRIFEHRPIKWLLEKGVIVICAGGGGIPTMYLPDETRTLVGVEAVINKDLASAL